MAVTDRFPLAARPIWGLLYVAATLMIIDQAAEVVASLAPFAVRDPQWRFGAYGVLAGRTTALVIIDALVLIAAVGRSQPRVLRVWASIHFILAPLIAAGLALFALDVVQLARIVRPDAATTHLMVSLRAGLIAALLVGYAIAVGVVARRAARMFVTAPGSTADPMLVVGEPRA